jgi:hypothetical protein
MRWLIARSTDLASVISEFPDDVAGRVACRRGRCPGVVAVQLVVAVTKVCRAALLPASIGPVPPRAFRRVSSPDGLPRKWLR